MIFISHRGNIDGPNEARENSPYYIMEALNMGYDVEVDVWYENGSFWLGHDFPVFKTDYLFLMKDYLWCHAKNLDALIEMKKHSIHYFWHENDTVSLTSKNYIWAFPGKQPIKNSISVLPELYDDDLSNCIGICSDYISNYKKTLQ